MLDAAREWGLEPSDIVVIGDKPSDAEAAKNAGATGVLVGKGVDFAQAVETILGA